MNRTSIQISTDTKALLKEQKHERETYDELVRRLVGSGDARVWTEEELRELIREECQ